MLLQKYCGRHASQCFSEKHCGQGSDATLPSLAGDLPHFLCEIFRAILRRF